MKAIHIETEAGEVTITNNEGVLRISIPQNQRVIVEHRDIGLPGVITNLLMSCSIPRPVLLQKNEINKKFFQRNLHPENWGG